MKRVFSILLLLCLSLALCACGKKSGQLSEETPSPEFQPTPEAWTAAPEEPLYPAATAAVPDHRNYHRVEITAENWKDYFQLREIPLYSITNSGVIAQVYQTYCVVLRDEIQPLVKPEGEYSVTFSLTFDLYVNTLKVDTKNYTYAHTDDLLYAVKATKSATFDCNALAYSAYGTDHSRYSGYSNAFFTGWATIHPESKVWSGFYMDLSQVQLESVSGYLELADP